MKNIIIGVLVVIAASSVYWYATTHKESLVPLQDQTTRPNEEDMRVAQPATTTTQGKLKVETFTGTLQDVNEGCYVDGECYAVVNGKHITIILGWHQEVGGQVLEAGGAPSSVGELKKYVGKIVEVYAQKKDDTTYTLYGSEGFYIEMK